MCNYSCPFIVTFSKFSLSPGSEAVMILQIWRRFLTNDEFFEFEEKVPVVDGTPASRTRRRLAHGWVGLGVFRPGVGRRQRRRRNRFLFSLCGGRWFESCDGVRGATLVLLGVR